MKQGTTVENLAQTLLKEKENSRDYIVPIEKIDMDPTGTLHLDGVGHKHPTTWAHSQLSSTLDIPKAYYDRIKTSNMWLLAQCVNHGLAQAAAKRTAANQHPSKMIRTTGNDVRAILSSRYRRLDCHDLLEQVLPFIMDAGMQIMSCDISDRKMFIKAVTPSLKADIKVGDTVQHGLVISGSDVGCGAIQVSPLNYRLVCSNGLITNTALRRHHIGRNLANDNIGHILSDRSRDLSDAAFWSSVRDVVRDSLRPEVFQNEVETLRRAAADEIQKDDIPEVIDLTLKAVGISDKPKNAMLKYLASGADGAGYNKWGLANAMTFAAQAEDATYEEATELEAAGGKIIALEKKDWEKIAI